MQAIRERSGGSVQVSTGSFYRRLSALIQRGLVQETAGPKVDDPRGHVDDQPAPVLGRLTR